MRFKLIAILLVVITGLLLFRDSRLQRALQSLSAERNQLLEEREVMQQRLETVERMAQSNSPRSYVPAPPSTSPSAVPAPTGLDRIAALESRVIRLERGPVVRDATRPAVPEYDPAQPPPPEEPIPPVAAAPAQQKRGWGPEQVAGPPDTHQSGDISTAWASRSPDGGPEWLSANFDQPVELAEVRVRETYNPGAISKVTAMVNGQEMTLWEGTAQGGSAPRDFVIRPPAGIQAQSVVVHLDTARVPGWNEIDAVELVGRDGSRQWASTVSASSTYAEPSPESLREVSTRFEETPTPNQFAPRR
jgi:hypothetical protein